MELEKTRWYLLDIECTPARSGYYCLCYEGDHLVFSEYFQNRLDADSYGDSWLYRETAAVDEHFLSMV